MQDQSTRAVHLWAKVDKDGPVPPLCPELGPCWLWTGYINPSGYGTATLLGRSIRSHRAAWIVTYGAIPEGLWVLHACDNPPCVNPAHLFLGDHQSNMDDMWNKGRGAVGDKNGTRRFPERMTRTAQLIGNSNTRGERNRSAKVTEDQVRQIRTRFAVGGITYAQLGEEFGITSGRIGDIVRGKAWRHVG